jgi:hypothetical protein
VIPSDAAAADILQSHTSIGFDRVPIMRDLNISYPVDRLRELVARGELGGSGRTGIRSWARCATRRASRARPGRKVGRRLAEEGVDAALVTPT